MLTNGHSYVTDAAGRVKDVSGELSLSKLDRNSYAQAAVGASGVAGDEGGHLIATALGGAGDRINILAQSFDLNRKEWRSMEKELQGFLAEGKSVEMKIGVAYATLSATRPSAFVVTVIVDGKSIIYPTFKQ